MAKTKKKVEGAFRISFTWSGRGLRPTKYLYDIESVFKTQLKSQVKNTRDYKVPYCVQILGERFDGTNWVVLEEWVGPSRTGTHTKQGCHMKGPTIIHYWCNENAECGITKPFVMACGLSYTMGDGVNTGDRLGDEITCKDCLNSDTYKNDMISFEVGFERDYTAFLESKK